MASKLPCGEGQRDSVAWKETRTEEEQTQGDKAGTWARRSGGRAETRDNQGWAEVSCSLKRGSCWEKNSTARPTPGMGEGKPQAQNRNWTLQVHGIESQGAQ